jgi:uncharacterized membrane protein YbhN (UPF0104 family)
MQLQMRVLLSYDSDSGPVARAGIDDAIFLWRAVSVYIPAIIGLGGFITYLIAFAKARRRHQPLFKK